MLAERQTPMIPTFSNAERRLAEYEVLLEIGVKLSSTLDLQTVLETALETAEQVCEAETSSIWELDEEKEDLFFRVVRGQAAGELRDLRVPVGQGIVGSVAASGKAELVNDVAADARWRGNDAQGFHTRAILTVPLCVLGSVIGVLQLLNPVGRDRFTEEDLQRMTLFAGLLAPPLQNARLYEEKARLYEELARLHKAQEQQFMAMIATLAGAIANKDPYTGDHVRRVVSYSLLLGTELGLGPGQLKELRLAATLHDIGKIGVPDRILGKPAPLDAEEAELMKKHTIFGAETVSHLANPNVLTGVRNHHERIDGRGYPDGLRDHELPLFARIIAVADTFDAMTTSRPYRAGLAPEQAAAEIIGAAGTQFCPEVVGAFRRLYDSGRFTWEASEEILVAGSD